MKIKYLIAFLLMLAAVPVARSQSVALKSNLLYDATLTLNGGVEVKFAPKWTSDLSANLNAWTVDNRRWKHWLVQPEARYWFCDRFAGHFIAGHALGGQYNVGGINPGISFLGTDFRKLADRRYQGWFVGAGVAYGYAWILGRHWNLEAEIGLGYIYTRFDSYPCAACGRKLSEDRPHHYVGPTKAAVNLVYTF